MPYVLGVDVGGSTTKAAVCLLDGSTWRPTELVPLGGRSGGSAGRAGGSTGAGSVLYLAEDGSTIAGDSAARRAAVEPGRIARGFLRRIGDDVPMVVGGEQYPAAELTGLLVGWVIERVAGARGERPDHVVLTHPAGWGPHRRALLQAELQAQGLEDVTLLPEPIAAAESYANRGRLDPGAALAVHTAGAHDTGSAVLRRARTGGFELLGTEEGAGPGAGDRLGGEHLDDLLVEHVRAALAASAGSAFTDLDPGDPRLGPALHRLRAECALAKEALSTAAVARVPVALPGVHTEVPVSRAEFEDLIRPSLRAAAARLPAALRYAGVEPGEPAAVVLTGGTGRIPLVAELLGDAADCRVSVEPDPEHTVVRGAALAARRLVGRRRGRVALPGPEQQTRLMPRVDGGVAPRPATTLDAPDDDFAEPPARPDVEVRPLDLPAPRGAGDLVPWLRPSVLGALVLLVIAAGVTATFYFHIGIGTSPSSPATPKIVPVTVPVRVPVTGTGTAQQPGSGPSGSGTPAKGAP